MRHVSTFDLLLSLFCEWFIFWPD